MFEGSLVESRGLVASRTQRWTALGSAAFQFLLAAMIVAMPLLRPGQLPLLGSMPRLIAPPPVRPREPVRVVTANAVSTAYAAPAPVAQMPSATRIFSAQPGMPTDDGSPPGPIASMQMGGGAPMPMASGASLGSSVVVQHEPSRPVLVSSGVVRGLMLEPIRPVYPEMARIKHTQGTVVVEAVISKTGRTESVRVVSGPALLQDAARVAVAAARYRPFLLSGQPVEVETTVTVVFTLGD